MDDVIKFPRRTDVVPFDTFVTKVVSRCNLNCAYCYMYNLQDKTWKGQPGVMKDDVRDAFANRVRAHALRHHLPHVHIILHGGEPLLMGKKRLKTWVETVRRTLEPEVRPWFSIQSNGTLIDDEWIDTLIECQTGIGISVDGPREYHDKFRKTHKGEGSYDDVVAAIRTCQKHPRGREISGNVMAVVNPDLPPRDLFDFWMELGVTGFDLSLPHANHAHPPYRGKQSYGDWMIEFFDLWFERNDPKLKIRYFENILRMLFGFQISTDNIGGKPVGVVVVETDGSIEPTDAFKSCDDGITKLGLNVKEHEFDALFSIPMVKTLQNGTSMLCATCQACALKDVCGGGYMPHRYSEENGFDNPSIYCEDIKGLVMHIRDRVLESLPRDVQLEMGVSNHG